MLSVHTHNTKPGASKHLLLSHSFGHFSNLLKEPPRRFWSRFDKYLSFDGRVRHWCCDGFLSCQSTLFGTFRLRHFLNGCVALCVHTHTHTHTHGSLSTSRLILIFVLLIVRGECGVRLLRLSVHFWHTHTHARTHTHAQSRNHF